MAKHAMIEFTDTNFNAEVISADVPVLVDFGAQWCQPCRILDPVINEIAKEYDGRAKVGHVDCDSNRQIPMRYGISAIPTVIMFKNGEIEKKYVGLTTKNQLKESLDGLL